MNFDKFSSWIMLLMWFWFEKVLEFTNLTNWLNNQNHVWAVIIQPKTEKLNMTSYDRIFIQDHEETCLIWFWYVFHEIWVKMCFCNPWWKSVSHGIRWRKRFEVMERMFCVWETSEKFEFSHLEKFFLTQQLRWDGKSLKLEPNPLFSWKSQVKL